MFIVGFFSWWYGPGWLQRFVIARQHIASFFDYFSIDLLLKTYFSPFRQISAGGVSGPIAAQIRAFFDQLISRVIGAAVRTFMIVAGIVTITLTVIVEAVKIAAWGLIPLIPIVGFVLMAIDWVPWLA